MYQISAEQKWDAEYYHELMDKRIVSSKKAKEIRDELFRAGALPDFDNNYDWAVLCIAYCFANGWATKEERLEEPEDGKGVEIPGFKTCFQDYARLWLVLLSDALFEVKQGQLCSKEDLYAYIQKLWHTGALELNRSWERCKQFKCDDDLAARQLFIQELSSLAAKQAKSFQGQTMPGSDGQDAVAEVQETGARLKSALTQAGVNLKDLVFLSAGVRYDIYRLRLHKYTELEKYHKAVCAALGVGGAALHISPCTNGEAFAYDLKWLRDPQTWQRLGADAFGRALQQYEGKLALPVCVGLDEQGEPRFEDLAEAPHILIGGTTGSGKSVFVRTLLKSLFDLSKGQDKLEVAILDPKKVDYQIFENEEDLWEERILDDYEEMYEFLQDCVQESENRYELMKEYRVTKLAHLPEAVRPRYRVIVVDEVANLCDNHQGIEAQLTLLAEKARASGIHLVLSTQRPDAATFKGRLRSNLPSRIALKVQKQTESKIILDEGGAENLLGKGDHLIKWNGGETYFLHGFDL